MRENARNLRKNMTDEEKRLWYVFLRDVSPRVKRQKVIGQYIVDFCCSKAMLIVELDGKQHYEPNGLLGDKIRDEWLNEQGYMVYRCSNDNIRTNFNAVCTDIYNLIKKRLGNVRVKEFPLNKKDL